MTPLIQNLLTASFYGSVIIAAVLVLRLILKKAPKRVICVLWMLAFIRLLMPFQLESTLSLQPEVVPLEETTFYETVLENTSTNDTAPLPNVDGTVTQPIIPENFDGNLTDEEVFSPLETETKEEPATIHWTSILPYFWLVGTICCLLYAIVSYIQLKRTVREAVKIIGCWECDRIETAFILGYIRPRIYVPMGLSRRTRRHILAHEWAHLQTGDHWFKLLAYLACCLHWFNPLVWVAYRFMCKDMEHACDERVVRYMNLEARKQYSHALLTCSTNHSHYTPCPVAFGEVSVKSRILSVLNYRKPSFWITLVAVIVVVCVGVFLMTSPVESESPDDEAPAAETTEYTEPLYPGSKQRQVSAATVDEFLSAIEPNTIIFLDSGTYNLWEAADYGKETDSEYYSWVAVGDGFELQIANADNLLIRGHRKDATNILAESRYANVISFVNCSRFAIENFTAGHTTRPEPCAGNVLSMENCRDVTMDDLGLFGCGTVGLSTVNCAKLKIYRSDIYDCSTNGIKLYETDSVGIDDCRFWSIGSTQEPATSMLWIERSDYVKISNCEFSNSYVHSLMQYTGSNHAELTDSRFLNNTVLGTAFFSLSQFVMDGTIFRDNNIRDWYDDYMTLPAVDANGSKLTEDILESSHKKTEQEPVSFKTARVSTVDEFLLCIGPNTEIILEPGVYDLSTATGYGEIISTYYYWQQQHDGPELVISEVENLIIRGSGKDNTTISAVPRYADVLSFSLCSNVTVADLTAGHTTEPGLCAGGVLTANHTDGFTVENCGLFGCGILGVEATDSSGITLDSSEIYECSQGGIRMYEVTDLTVQNCIFRDLGGKTFDLNGCQNVVLENNVVPDEESSVSPNDSDSVAYPIDIENDIIGVKDLDEFTLTYAGIAIYEYTDVIGHATEIIAVNVPYNIGEIIWTTDNPEAVRLTNIGDNACEIEPINTGKAVVSATCGGKTASVTVYCRESW